MHGCMGAWAGISCIATPSSPRHHLRLSTRCSARTGSSRPNWSDSRAYSTMWAVRGHPRRLGGRWQTLGWQRSTDSTARTTGPRSVADSRTISPLEQDTALIARNHFLVNETLPNPVTHKQRGEGVTLRNKSEFYWTLADSEMRTQSIKGITYW